VFVKQLRNLFGAFLFFVVLPPILAVAVPNPLTAREVGQYAGQAWGAPGSYIDPGSTTDRTNPLRFTVRSVTIREDSPEPNIANIVQEIQWGMGYSPQRTMLVRINFWGGVGGQERYTLPIQNLSVYTARVDFILNQLVPVLDSIQGITLSEENVPDAEHSAILQGLYWHVKELYPNLKVYQWWTPNTAIPDWYAGIYVPADGWVFDPYTLCVEMYPDSQYHMGPDPYLTLVRKYYVTGLPCIPMQNASDEAGLDVWYNINTSPYPTTMWIIVNNQRTINKAFNLPTSYYWAHNGTTYFPLVTGVTLMDQITTDVRNHCLQMSRYLPANWNGDPCVADIWSGHMISVPVGSQTFYSDDFHSSKFIDDSSGQGFRDFIHNGSDLRTRGFNNRTVNDVIVYHLTSTGVMNYPQIKLDAQVEPSLIGRVKISASVNNINWPISVQTDSNAGVQHLSLATASQSVFAQPSEFYVKVELSGSAGTFDSPAVRIDNLAIVKGCGAWGIMDADLNKDCYVDLRDIAILAEYWQQCTNPTNPQQCIDAAP
jgi:hypothetical protein